jgi:O-antigen/teichoic acid export membrane protein
MSTARVHARNLLANWGSHAANMVVMFFLSPFIVHTLGETEYGVWSLLMVLTGYMGVFDLGIRASTGRHIILYYGRGDHDHVNETIRTGLGFFSVAVFLIVVIAAAIAWGFPHVFASVPEECHTLVQLLLPLLALNLWLSAVAAVFASVLIAHDRFDLTCGVDMGVLAVRTVGTVLALQWGYGILGLTVVTLACGAVALTANYALARRLYQPLKVWPVGITRARLRELFDYGVPAFVCTVADQTTSQAGMLIVGVLVSVASVTVYSVGAMLVFYSSTFIGLVATTFFPAVQRAAARGDKASLQKQYLRQVRLGLVCGLPAYLGFIVFGEAFIRLWMGGPKFPENSVVQAAVVMAVLSGARLIGLLAMGSQSMLAATGYVRITSIIAITEAIVNISLSLLLVAVFGWGLLGVAVGFMVASILVSTCLFPWQAMRRAHLSYRPYLAIVGSGAVTAAAVAAWYLGVRAVLPVESWPTFALDVVLALLGYGVIVLAVLASRDDRKWLLGVLGRVPKTSEKIMYPFDMRE